MEDKSFKVGVWRVEPAHNRIRQVEKTITLEPRVMELLVVLAEYPGKVLSKDQLVKLVWKDAVVSDSAITWTVSRLRRALVEDGSDIDYIATVPKKGYRLEVQPVPIDETAGYTEGLDPVAGRLASRWRPIMVLAGVVGLVVVILIVTIRSTRPPQPPRYPSIPGDAFVPLTSMLGREEMGAFSPSGDLLAFAHKSGVRSSWDLYLLPLSDERLFRLTDVDGSETQERRRSARRPTPIRLTNTTADDVWPAWSPSSRQVAFFRHAEQGCELRLLTLSPGDLQPAQDELLLNCHPSSTGRVAWRQDGNQILFSDRLDAKSPHALFAFDLLSGDRKQVSFPETGGPGDRVFSLSPDGALALFRHNQKRETRIMVGRLPDLSLSEALVLPYYLYAVDWTSDGNAIVFNDSDYRLVAFEPGTGDLFSLLSRQERIWNLSYVPGQDRLSFSSLPRRASNIRRLDLDGSGDELLVQSSFVDRTATRSRADGSLAFVSDRTGMPQIWQRLEDGTELQLSDAREWQSFDSLQWSPDGRHILAVSNGTAGSLDLRRSSFHVHSAPGQRSANPFWSMDGSHIYYRQLDGDDWKLVRIAFDDAPERAEKVLDTPLIDAKRANDAETIYLFRSDTSGLWRLDAGDRNLILVIDLDPGSILDWQVSGQFLYLTRRENRELVLYQTRLDNGQPSHVLTLPPAASGQLSMDFEHGAIYATIEQEIESNIVIQKGSMPF